MRREWAGEEKKKINHKEERRKKIRWAEKEERGG